MDNVLDGTGMETEPNNRLHRVLNFATVIIFWKFLEAREQVVSRVTAFHQRHLAGRIRGNDTLFVQQSASVQM